MSRKDMIVVIQCAKSKHPCADYMRVENGQPIMFVADPQKAPPDKSVIYRHPDGLAHQGRSWRDMLVAYNREYRNSASDNPLGLLPAWRFYKRRRYGELVSAFGAENVFILSTCWGLISSDFLTPRYNVTFSSGAAAYERRRRNDRYEDLVMLPEDTGKPVVFLGGKDYVPLFCSLTEKIRSERTVFYNSGSPPDAPGCRLRRFHTEARTNWHYICAGEIIRENT